MRKTRKTLVIGEIRDRAGEELKSMVEELLGEPPRAPQTVGQRRHWSRRFAASGKTREAPKLRGV